MKDCGYQITASYDGVGHTEDKWQKKNWNGLGAVDDLISYLKRMGREDKTKKLKSLEIRLSLR